MDFPVTHLRVSLVKLGVRVGGITGSFLPGGKKKYINKIKESPSL